MGLFYWENDHQCKKAWEIGRIFVNLHATTEADVYNEKLIMNHPPPMDTTSVCHYRNLPSTMTTISFFLTIRCRDSQAGKELCAGQKVKELRSLFRTYINDGLSRVALSSKMPTP